MSGEPENSVEIIGPFQSSELVIDGYRVPAITAHEGDGGRMTLVLDHRIGVEVDTKHFDQVARFVADVIGHCWGYGAHPRPGVVDDDRAFFARVPHPSLAPSRMVGIGAVKTGEPPDGRDVA